jgi:hypothetical protein
MRPTDNPIALQTRTAMSLAAARRWITGQVEVCLASSHHAAGKSVAECVVGLSVCGELLDDSDTSSTPSGPELHLLTSRLFDLIDSSTVDSESGIVALAVRYATKSGVSDTESAALRLSKLKPDHTENSSPPVVLDVVPSSGTFTTEEADRAYEWCIRHLLLGDMQDANSVCRVAPTLASRGLTPEAATERVARALGIALYARTVRLIHERDLSQTAALMRTAHVLGFHSFKQESIRYLLSQQNEAGYFGRFAAEAAAISHQTGLRSTEVDRRLKLPMTVACLSALAEMTWSHYRLLT